MPTKMELHANCLRLDVIMKWNRFLLLNLAIKLFIFSFDTLSNQNWISHLVDDEVARNDTHYISLVEREIALIDVDPVLELLVCVFVGQVKVMSDSYAKHIDWVGFENGSVFQVDRESHFLDGTLLRIPEVIVRVLWDLLDWQI